MGCDGGTIPRRDELVRLKKKPEQKDKDSEREFRWLHCTLTQQRLQEPIVMCGLGRLYSKQSIIEKLLEKDKIPQCMEHIKSMKDIKQLSLTPNPAYNSEMTGKHSPYICKLIGLEMSGNFRFIALWNCGCVMSERALKQINGKSSGGYCPLCQKVFSVEDVIVLNGTDEDLELMRVKIEMRYNKRKSNKKDKNTKRDNIDDTSLHNTSEKLDCDSETASDLKYEDISASSSNSSLKKIKLVANSKRLGVCSDGLEDPELKRLKNDYSVAKDPKASDVYKSLFTSHKSEKEQERAHWITYNPFYN